MNANKININIINSRIFTAFYSIGLLLVVFQSFTKGLASFLLVPALLVIVPMYVYVFYNLGKNMGQGKLNLVDTIISWIYMLLVVAWYHLYYLTNKSAFLSAPWDEYDILDKTVYFYGAHYDSAIHSSLETISYYGVPALLIIILGLTVYLLYRIKQIRNNIISNI